MDKEFDIVIIGNGIIGQSIAFKQKLSDQNKRILIIGPSNMSGSASVASGAMLGCFSEVTKYTFDNEAGKKKFDMSYSSHKEWSHWIKDLESVANKKLSVIKGTYLISNTSSGKLDDENFEAVKSSLEKFREPYSEVNPNEISGLNPVASNRPLRALFMPDENATDSSKLLELIEIANKNLGVQYLNDEFKDFNIEGDKILSMITKQGKRILSKNFISCLGAFTHKLLDKLPEKNKLIPSLSGIGVSFVGQRVLGKGFSHTIRTINRAGSCGLHLIPLGENKEYIGATNTIFYLPEKKPILGMGHFLSQCVIDQIDRNTFYHRIIEWKVGNRPVTIDTFPAIGWSHIDNLLLVYGTYRDGLHSCPFIAKMIKEFLVDNEKSNPKNNIFSPLRTPIPFSSYEKSISEFAHQCVSSAYENELQLPRYMQLEMFDDHFKKIAEDVYQRVGDGYIFHPDILQFLAFTQRSQKDEKEIVEYLKFHNL